MYCTDISVASLQLITAFLSVTYIITISKTIKNVFSLTDEQRLSLRWCITTWWQCKWCRPSVKQLVRLLIIVERHTSTHLSDFYIRERRGGCIQYQKESILSLIFHSNYLGTETLMSCAYQSEVVITVKGEDSRPCSAFVRQRVVTQIWRGADRSSETVFDDVSVEKLIGSPGTLGRGFALHCWRFGGSLQFHKAVKALPFLDGRLYCCCQTTAGALFIGHQHWTRQAQSHMWGTEAHFHTWTAMGHKKPKFNYWDSIGKHKDTKWSHPQWIYAHIATCTDRYRCTNI